LGNLQSQHLLDFLQYELLQRFGFDWVGTVQDKYLVEVEREVEKEHRVPMDKVLKVEIYELLHAADCAKVLATLFATPNLLPNFHRSICSPFPLY